MKFQYSERDHVKQKDLGVGDAPAPTLQELEILRKLREELAWEVASLKEQQELNEEALQHYCSRYKGLTETAKRYQDLKSDIDHKIGLLQDMNGVSSKRVDRFYKEAL
ncbi:hypothetical protein H1R20_g1893, partial [Candolleomyces eurysporus]